MTENSISGSDSHPHDIYDRMFKRLLTLSAKAEIRFINGLFGTDYPDDSTISYNWTEFENDKMKKVLADTIITINGRDAFHIEAEMSDDSIILRVLEYGFNFSLRTMREITDPETGEKVYTVTFPRQAVIYLDSAGTVPETQTVLFDFGAEGSFRHHVTVIRFQEKTAKEIRERSMVILLPFKLLSLRKDLQKKRSQENIRKLLNLYRNDIICVIEQMYLAGQISAGDRKVLLSAARQLMEHLYQKYEEIQEVIRDMHDHSLRLDVDDYIDALESKDEEIAKQQEELERQHEELERRHEELREMGEQIRLLTERLAQYESKAE